MTRSPLHAWIAAKIGVSPAELTRARLAAYQLQKLQETLQLARMRSPFYRRHLANAPAEITNLADLRHFPLTTAANLRQHERQLLCVSQSEIERVVTLPTSGTTGEPKRLYFTAADQELTRDFFHVGMSTFTGAGDRVLVLLPGAIPGSVGYMLAEALPRLGAVAIQHEPKLTVADTLELLHRERITGLVATPTQALALARRPNGAAVRLKSCLLVSDYVSTAIVRAVEAQWRCQVFTHYGMTEMGLGGGVECAARRGYHLREADLYVEVINPATDEPALPGETGEVVFTTLARQGMPLIRYRTGDLSHFAPGDCPCGAALLTLARLGNRLDGRVELGAGQYLTMPHLDEALFPIAGLLNFAAQLGPHELKIEATAVPGSEAAVAAAFRPALEALPAVRLALANGGLRLLTTVEPELPAASLPSPAKRIIRQI